MRHRLYLARHGETEWNALGRLQGATDIPLAASGRAQAEALGESLRGEGIVSITTSDLARARQTGEIAGVALGLTAAPFVDHELRERSFGIFEGLTRDQLEAEHTEAWRAWRASGLVPTGGEAQPDIVARMTRGIARCFARSTEAGGPMLIVSHGAAMRLFLTEVTTEVILPIANGAVYRLDLGDDGTAIGVEPWTPPTL
jgi:broad specificity phosphatase PhoE